MSPDELTGRSRTHIVDMGDPPCALHRHTAIAFLHLRRAAAVAGFALQPVSSFRDFDRQLAIWNDKFTGARPVNDVDGRPLDVMQMSAAERVAAILLWSALPGASRHHWGTDIDVIDARSALPGGSDPLLPDNFAPGGAFAPLSEWLDQNASQFGFFRPYRGVLSGVRAEPWHLSFAPVADAARRALDIRVLRNVLGNAALEGKAVVLMRLTELHTRYVMAIDWP